MHIRLPPLVAPCDELLTAVHLLVAGQHQHIKNRLHNLPPIGVTASLQFFPRRADGRLVGGFGFDGLDNFSRRLPIFIHKIHIILPRRLLFLAHSFGVFPLHLLQLLRADEFLAQHPVAHSGYAIVLHFPRQSFGRFIPLMAPRGRMPLWLGHFDDVNDGRDVVLAGVVGRFLVRLDQRRVIPSFHRVNVVAVAPPLPLEAREQD